MLFLIAAILLLIDVSHSESSCRGSHIFHATTRATWEESASNTAPFLQEGFKNYWYTEFKNGSAWNDTDYVWFSTSEDRLASIQYHGEQSRLRMALHRFLNEGKNLTVAFVGGSITQGRHGPPETRWSFPDYFELILRKLEPFRTPAAARLTVINAGAAGTSSSYMALCHSLRLPQNVDLVVLEYSKNDAEGGTQQPINKNPLRRTFERLLRKLSAYPNRPAIMILHTALYMKDEFFNQDWGVERDLQEFGYYYRTPMISVRTAVYHKMHAWVEGYWPTYRFVNMVGYNESLFGKAFYHDGGGHPDPFTGYRLMGELVASYVLDTAQGLSYNPVTAKDQDRATHSPLPVPMIKDNYESKSERCLVEGKFKHVIEETVGFNWTDEGRGKWGYVATTVGSYMLVKFDSSMPGRSADQDPLIGLRVAYLMSYENAGTAVISCHSGCECQQSLVNAHNPKEKLSLMKLHRMEITQSQECRMRIEVAKESTSTNSTYPHKVKILGLMVSEDPPVIASKHEWLDVHEPGDNEIHRDGLFIGRRSIAAEWY